MNLDSRASNEPSQTLYTGFGHREVTGTLEKAFDRSTWEGVCYQTCNAQGGDVSGHMVWDWEFEVGVEHILEARSFLSVRSKNMFLSFYSFIS